MTALCWDLGWTWGTEVPGLAPALSDLTQKGLTRPDRNFTKASLGLMSTSQGQYQGLTRTFLVLPGTCCLLSLPPLLRHCAAAILSICSSRHKCFTSSESWSVLFPLSGRPASLYLTNFHWFPSTQLERCLLGEPFFDSQPYKTFPCTPSFSLKVPSSFPFLYFTLYKIIFLYVLIIILNPLPGCCHPPEHPNG